MKRITIVVGHFGSGKTEFSVNLAIDLKKKHEKVTLCDLDIANPYFRSREKKELLEKTGIKVVSNVFDYDIAEDLPAVSPAVKGPFQNKEMYAVMDVGGDSMGAKLLNQYKESLNDHDVEVLFVINGNRKETDNLEGCMGHINSVIAETGVKISGLINNTHMVEETVAEDIIFGHKLCKKIEKEMQIPLKYDIVVETLELETKELGKKENLNLNLYKINLLMRPKWLSS